MLSLFVVVYVAVALLNYSLVQSVAGSVASSWFSSEWGGKVRIGSMGCNPFNHLTLRNVELINPDNDTVCIAHTMSFKFKRFPFDEHGLSFSQIRLKDTYYHVGIDSTGLNLNFIIEYYKSKASPKRERNSNAEFKVLADDLIMDNVTYRHDLDADRTVWDQPRDDGRVNIRHQEWANIHARMRNVRVDKDYVTCRIDQFTTRERSGLSVNEMNMNVYATRVGISATNMILETDDSRLMGDVLLDFNGWKTMKHFMDSVVFTCHFTEGSYGGLRDAAFWTGTLEGMDERVYIDGWFGGPLADFHADDAHLAFGDESSLDLDCSICGLPKIDTTVISAAINNLHTTYADLVAVRHPAGVSMKGAKIIKTLDGIDADLTFAGTIYDFYATLDVMTAPGRVQGDVRLAMNPRKKEYRYVGTVSSESFLLGRLAPNEWVSRSGFDIAFEGTGFDPRTMNASAQGRLKHTVVRGQRIIGETALDVEAVGGKVKAEVGLDDVLAALSIDGEMEFREQGPIYRANVDVEHLDLKRLGLWQDTSDSEAMADLRAGGFFSVLGEGSSYGRLNVSKAQLHTSHGDCGIADASLTAREQSYWRDWRLTSDIVSAQMKGYFDFDDPGSSVKRFIDEYVPQIAKPEDKSKKTDNGDAMAADARFEFNATLHDASALLQMFAPDLHIASGTTVQANYNYAESFKPIVRSDSIGWGSLRLYNIGVSGESMADLYRLRVTSDEIKIGDVLLSENSDISMETSKRAAICRAYWQNSSQAVGGGDVNVRLFADSGRVCMAVDPSQLALGGRVWQLECGDWDGQRNSWKPLGSAAPDEHIFLDSKGFRVGGLAMVCDEQMLLLRASRRGELNDSINLTFNNFDLDVANSLLGALGMSADGVVNGDVRIAFINVAGREQGSANREVPYLNADLAVAGLGLDGELLGDARLRSTWNADMNQLNMLVDTRRDNGSEPLQIVGYLDMGRDDPELNFTASVDNVDMKILRPFVNSFSSDIKGSLYADADIGGTLKQPVVEGYVYLDEASLKVDFLNVTYNVSDTIRLEREAIRFDDFAIRDERGNTASVRGSIQHNHLNDMRFFIDVESERLLCMNTTARNSEQYYGTVLASLDGTVRGAADDINVVLNARSASGSALHIPINDKRQLKQVDYIHFGSWTDDDETGLDDNLLIAGSIGGSDNEKNGVQKKEEVAESRFLLTINVETTPDVQLVLPMDFSSVKVDVDARGGGDLQLQVGSDNPFSLKGDYEIIGGTVALDILGVMGKDFAIDEGSSITFPGAVSDALFDIKAVYSQRVNMSTLTGSLSATESQKPVQVENVIALTGTLQAPGINFDLRLPNADQSVQEEVFAYIDRTNERDMLNQTVSLLLFKRFYNSSASTNADLGTSTAEEGYGLVANTLGNMVSDMVDFVDINFDYQAGNALTREQYAVDISKEWNKFYFETSLGFGGEAREMSNANGVNNMTGDMVVGYKINPRFHLFVFNRSNTNDYTRSDLPYKQGVGVKYTRDFDTFGELWRRKNKKK